MTRAHESGHGHLYCNLLLLQGPIGEVHLKFKIGNIVFHDRFMILNNLQCDRILRLPWQ